MFTNRTLLAAFAVVTLIIATGQLWGQAVEGSQISGLVEDSSGATVPNATVTVTQTDRQLVRTTVSGTDGIYVFPDLPVGPYTLKAQASGFATLVQTGIRLEVGSPVSINLVLHVGTVQQQVEVSTNANQVETQTTSVSEVVDQQRIVDLPLNGRQATQLIFVSGAATTGPTGDIVSSKNYPTSIAVSVAGSQVNGTNYLLDGGEHTDPWATINLPFPFPDALQEFSVQTSSLSARYGVHPGAVVNTVTKSGTDQLHGTVFEFMRNGAVNALNFFSTTPDKLKRNQFGGVIGGPILKNKLFFFGGYQGTRVRTAPSSNIAHVPTEAVLNGDWSQFESANCRSTGANTIVDPATGQAFANDQVNPALYNSAALQILKLLPRTSDPCGRVAYSIPEPSREDQLIGRVDWVQSAKSTLFGRYFVTDYAAPASFNNNLLEINYKGILDRVQTVELGNTYTFTPTTINSVRLGYSRLAITRSPTTNTPNPTTFGINVYALEPNLLNIGVQGYISMEGTPKLTIRDNNTNVADDLDLIRGRHHISAGGEWIRYNFNLFGSYWGDGNFGFNGQYSNDALLDFMLGLPNEFDQAGAQYMNVRQDTPGIYGMDNIQVNRHLNLQLGMRWEPFLPEREIHDRVMWFDPAAFAAGTHSTQFPNAPAGLAFPGDPGFPTGGAFANRELALFQPRAGLVWDPTGRGRQVIRVGYGLFYDQPGAAYTENTDFGAPWGSVVSFTPSLSGGLTNPYQAYPGGTPFPISVPPPKDTIFAPYSEYYIPQVNFKATQTQQWNVAYQVQLRGDWLVTATYLGNKTSHVWLENEGNPSVYIPGNCVAGQYGLTAPGPCSTPSNANQRRELYLQNPVEGSLYSTMPVSYTGGNSSFHGLLLSAQHRFSSHYSVLGNYTWSHCISIGDQMGDLGGGTFQNPFNPNSDRGNCGYDIRNNLNVSFIAESFHFASPWMNRLFGNWQLSGILSRTSGAWFSPYTGTDNSLSAVGNDYPNLTGNPYASFNHSNLQWLNPQAFVPNALGTFGDAGRDSLRGPGQFGLDTSLVRYFNITERQRLQVRFESFNLLNHPNFGLPDPYLTDSTFGQISTAGDPRILQLALKYSF